MSSDGKSQEDENVDDIMNISAESEHLNADEKAAHEADTLPMESDAAKAAAVGVRQSDSKRFKVRFVDPWLTSRNALPAEPTRGQLLLHSLRCPPHGKTAQAAFAILTPVVLWMVCWALLGSEWAAPPSGTAFLLIVMVVLALLAGFLVQLIKLPPLLGMLLVGIALKNIPGLEFGESWKSTSSTLRTLALAIILMRAGLGLDPQALKRLSGTVFRLAFIPCLVETLVVAVASRFLLNFPWLWGFMLGFVLAAVSPAVVVPCLLQLQERGFGVDKGIPTLVIAAASVDDVLAISGFTILVGVTFKPGNDLVAVIFQGPLEAFLGIVFGIAWGFLVTFIPSTDAQNVGAKRFLFLFGGCLMALFGFPKLELAGAGPLAVLVAAFVAASGWKRRAHEEEGLSADWLAKLWFIFQPILFGLIGTEIQIDRLDPQTVGLGIAVLITGLTFRLAASLLSVSWTDLSLKERLFVALAWLPKATVQAAIGPVAYDTALNVGETDETLRLGLQVLTIAVLVILITAPIGAVAIMLSAPKLLKQSDPEQANNDPEKSN